MKLFTITMEFAIFLLIIFTLGIVTECQIITYPFE